MIDDEDDVSGVGTLANEKNTEFVTDVHGTNGEANGGKDEEREDLTPVQPPVELPLEVRSKLRKLEKMESRYQGRWECRSSRGYAYSNF